MIDIRRLTGIVEDNPAEEWVRVRAGTQWLELCDYLAPQGRRPVSLTTNARSTIAGTLSVGGFGDTTHRRGLQTASVLGLTLITPDGDRHEVGPEDELFRFALCGLGQLGAITEVTLRTLRAPYRLFLRRMEWKGIGHFVRDAVILTGLRIYDFMRMRLFWRSGNAIEGICARFSEVDLPPDATPDDVVEPGFNLLQPAEWANVQSADLLEQDLRRDARESWKTYACPAVEFVLPLPEGLDVWAHQLNRVILESGMLPYLAHGSAIVLTPRQHLPLAPVPDADFSLMVALRPIVPIAQAARFVEPMGTIAAAVIDAGARLYPMSIQPDRERLKRQFGAAWQPWLELKQRVDPLGLCNPGLLIG